MAFMRNQYDTSYGNDYSQRSFKPQASTSSVQQQNQGLVTYPWQSIGGYQNQTSQQGFGNADYNFGYGDYNKNNSNQNFNAGGYSQDSNKGFDQDTSYKNNYGLDYNKSTYGQDYNKSSLGQDYNKSNLGQSNYGQDYNKGNLTKQDYNQGNYNTNTNDGSYKQGYYGDEYKQQGYNESSYGQDYSDGYYGEASFNQQDTGYGGEVYNDQWHSADSGNSIQWQGASAGFGRGRGAAAGNLSPRGGFGRGGSGFSRGGFTQGDGNVAAQQNVGGVNQGSYFNSRGGGAGFGGRGGAFNRFAAATISAPATTNLNYGMAVTETPEVTTPIQKPPVPAIDENSTHFPDLLKRWQLFCTTFADCGNPISNLECSLKASKVPLLQLEYDCTFLTKVGNFNIFSGVLYFKKQNSDPEEKIFVTRGFGMNKKTTKMDVYDRAFKLLMNPDVDVITQQEDCGETVLRQDLHHKFRQDPDKFMEVLKTGEGFEEFETPEQALKRKAARSRKSESKRARHSDPNDSFESKNLSLAPTKKVEMVMYLDDDLVEKMYALKQLLREEGITRLHIVPKIDQLAHKAAIHVVNVYRYEDPKKEAMYCEIYFDDVYMTRGASEIKSTQAMQKAYTELGNLMCMRNLEQLFDNPSYWHPVMFMDPDIYDIVEKLPGRDNDSILTSNLANMKQMMMSMPDVTIPIDKMVLTEHESDKGIANVFKSLELSATRNLMLLECEIMRNPEMNFTCALSLQGRVLATRQHATKNGAKRLCSEFVMNKMKLTHDIIYVKTDLVGKVITHNELLVAAAKKKALGDPPGKIFKKLADYKDEFALLTPEEKRKLDSDTKKLEDIENLPENVSAKPLFPWIAAAMYDCIDEFYRKITLEDLMLDIADMPKSQREIISFCASKMGLRMVTKAKTSFDGPILRRAVTAQDMSKILQLNLGESGRYKLISCKNPLTQEELQQFRNQCLENHRLLVEARINDNPDADPEVPVGISEFSPGNIYDRPGPSRVGPFRGGPRAIPDDGHFSGPPDRRGFGGPPRPLMGPRIRPTDSFSRGRRMFPY